MKIRPAAFAILAAAVLIPSGCHNLPTEGPETAPSGPPVLSEAMMREALSRPVNYEKHIKPLFIQNCLPCHDGREMPHLVNLTSRESVFAAGPYGRRVIPGKPDESLVIKNLSLTHATVKPMPPVGSRMTPQETRIIRKWITEGATWP
jgi:hypothetical protein